ncbi:MAG: pyruvate kinase [Candidatus Peregrinibacteria bacterium Gr01-1014_25]|nr:MAG: pyruvate kinase [Candidatus Peregrinibacteria bacterium Gr01-1014_25]
MRLTKIICTLGPATASPESIRGLLERGMNVARINFSHGSREQHTAMIAAVQEAGKALGIPVGILLDTKGAEIRTGDRKVPLAVHAGDELVFSPFDMPEEKRPVVHVNYDGFASDVRNTPRILVDNGEMVFEVVSVDPKGFVVARANDDGSIGSRRHINLPGVDIDLPSVTAKDWDDIAFGIDQGMDYVALSFIRTAKEMAEVKEFIRNRGSHMLAIAKIETQLAVDNLDAIIDASDGVMIARGDLGAEIPFERIPAIQHFIIERCTALGKPVIVATHMLESMTQHPMPTRAEVTDVAHAAMGRTDCTMLSGETAGGKHPFLALEAMDRILRETESHLSPLDPTGMSVDEHDARARAAVSMANALRIPAIAVLTRSGKTAAAVSRLRPLMPILTAAPADDVRRRMQILYGVQSVAVEFHTDPEQTVQEAFRAFRAKNLLKSGDRIVLVSDTKTQSGRIGSVQVRTVD